MSKISKIKIILTAGSTALLMVGCGDSTAVLNGSEKQEEILLTVLAGQSTSDAGIEDMIDEMVAEKFPQVTLEWECVDWGERFDSQMRGRFATGDPPDIIIGKAQDVYSYTMDGSLRALRINRSDQISRPALEAVTVNGEIYGLPYNAWYQGVVYNKEIFTRLGLQVPGTTDQLEEAVKWLEKNGIVPFAAHFQENWKIGNMTMQVMTNELFVREPDWGERFRNGAVDFRGNRMISNCIETNRYILEHTWRDALMIDQNECDKRFAREEAAMYLTGSWSLQELNQYEDNTKYGIFPYPNRTGDARLIRETNMTFMLSSTSEYPELITEIFNELLENEQLKEEILGFTQTYSIITGETYREPGGVTADIKAYEENRMVVEASVGNSQLIWQFQYNLAGQILVYLRGEQALSDIMEYADAHRKESSKG